MALHLIDAGLGTEVHGAADEAHQFWRRARVAVHLLPLHHLAPRAFVHGVVDSNDACHVLLLRAPSFALHGVVKHLRRRIHPVGRADALLVRRAMLRAARDARHSALRRQGLPLAEARVLALPSRQHVVAAVHARVQEDHRVVPRALVHRHGACRRRVVASCLCGRARMLHGALGLARSCTSVSRTALCPAGVRLAKRPPRDHRVARSCRPVAA